MNKTPSFSCLIAHCGLTKADVARICEVAPCTVSRWGDSPPAIVLRYLELHAASKYLVDLEVAVRALPVRR